VAKFGGPLQVLEVMVSLDHDPGSRSRATETHLPRGIPRDEVGSQHGPMFRCHREIRTYRSPTRKPSTASTRLRAICSIQGPPGLTTIPTISCTIHLSCRTGEDRGEPLVKTLAGA
jgi:hypothetical protein